jgi:hypothetical protein
VNGRSAGLVAGVLAASTLYAGIHWGSTVAGGADSYGYVSQANLWLHGQLRIHQDIVRASPWPLAINTWAPLGYRASPDEPDAIVPLYSPGLPLMMALFQRVDGFCAAFLVVPISGAAVVWLTYLLGQRLFATPRISLSAAVFVATSPIFLYQLMNPMTDVPVTAALALVMLLAIDGWPLAAGAAASVAILIRPNLAPVTLVPLAWLLLTRGRPIRFVLGLAPGVIVIAAINRALYGAPWISGYGTLGDLYGIPFFPTNVRQFSAWLFATQTPFVSLAAMYFIAPTLFVPSRIAYPRLLVGGSIATTALCYLFYLPFDAWWYLRFLLPMWPAMMLSTAAAVDALTRQMHRHASAIALAISTIVVGTVGLHTARERLAFDIGRGERRYVDVARFVSGHTDPAAVAIALQHTGTLRLYAGRLTLRFDQLDPAWLDRVAEFLTTSGRHPYIVLEGDELELFKTRFSGSELGRLDWPPMAAFDNPRIVIYDAADRTGAGAPLAIAAGASRRVGWRCDAPY